MKLQARTGSIVLGGVTLPVRALTMAEADAIARCRVRPRPATELVFDPNLGRSMRMEKVDPAIDDARREWAAFMQCAEVAAAAGLESVTGSAFDIGWSDELNAKWAAEIVAEMRAAFTWAEIEAASRVIGELSSAAGLAGAAVKN